MKLRRTGIITILIACILIAYAAVRLTDNYHKINEANEENESLTQQVTDKEVANAELKYYIEHSDDDSVIADIARDDLGLVEPGEKVFYDSGT